jgi:nucleoside-diphosphate-sugar epimerase
MKILIIGGTSSVGHALKQSLSHSHEVITAGRRNCDIIFDLNDPIEDITFPTNIDVIIHTAAYMNRSNNSNIIETFNVNVIGTLKMCQVASKSNAKHFILFSSIFALIKENTAYYSIYSLSKKQSEDTAKIYCSSSSMKLTILRPSQIYGNFEKLKLRQPFLSTMIQNAKKGKEVLIYGSHDAKINIIHINDLIDITKQVIDQKTEGTYACTHPQNISYAEFAKKAFQAFGTQEKIRFDTSKDDIPDNIFDEDNRLYEKIGLYPKISLDEGLKEIAKHKNQLYRTPL